MVLCWKKVGCPLQDWRESLPQVEECKNPAKDVWLHLLGEGEPAEVVQASGQNAVWTLPRGGVLVLPGGDIGAEIICLRWLGMTWYLPGK